MDWLGFNFEEREEGEEQFELDDLLDDLLLLVRRAGQKHAGVEAPAPQFVKVACYTHP
jgi:hypothetical protein